MAVVERVLQAAEKAGVFGIVVGADAEKLTKFGEDHAPVVLNEGSIAGWARVAAGSAVAVGVDPLPGLRPGAGWGFGEEVGHGGTVGHLVSLPEGGRGGAQLSGFEVEVDCLPLRLSRVYWSVIDFLTSGVRCNEC
jgi:hypothetical protein